MATILPFQTTVSGTNDSTLLTWSCRHGVPLSDLRQANPHLDKFGCGDVLPAGEMIYFPPMVSARQPAVGPSVMLGTALEDIQSAEGLLSELHHSSAQGRVDQVENQHTSIFIPKRRVATRAAQLVHIVRQEGSRQLAEIAEQFRTDVDPNARYGSSWKDLLVEEAVSTEQVTSHMKSVEKEFAECCVEAVDAVHSAILSQPPQRLPLNVVSEKTEHTAVDKSAVDDPTEHLTCRFSHTRAVELTFLRPGTSTVIHETWAVLPCQTLGALVDALECPNALLPYPDTQNSFFFINGVFYVDDRHDGWEDISSVVRNGSQALSNGAAPSASPYAACPVVSVQTRFADIRMRQQELCVFRHLGSCDHYFYWSDVSPATAVPRPRIEFPRRVYLVAPKVTLCEMCALLPATIATYGDALAPKNPALYCPPCFRIFHVNELGEEVNDGYLKFELPPGKHF